MAGTAGMTRIRTKSSVLRLSASFSLECEERHVQQNPSVSFTSLIISLSVSIPFFSAGVFVLECQASPHMHAWMR
jgi:hypothetical protein